MVIFNHYHCLAESEGQCASHVIVMRHGRIFTFDAVDSRGEVITAPEFEVQLKRIMEICEGQPHGPGIGSLTGHNRTQWYKVKGLVSFSTHWYKVNVLFHLGHSCTR